MSLRSYATATYSTTATSGSTTGLTPITWETLSEYTTQIIVHNKHATETLYIFCYNKNVDPGLVDLSTAMEVSAGAYLTLSLGSRTESVGSRTVAGFNTSASAFDFKITQIFSIQA